MKHKLKRLMSISLFLILSTVSWAQLAPGSTAPDFSGTDIEGEQHQLTEYLSQGKWVLLKFGFITCAPCHDATFGMNLIYHGFGCNQEDLIVLGVDPLDNGADYDNYWETWDVPFTPEGTIQNSHTLSTHNYPMICTDGGSVDISNAYGLEAAPSYFLINPDGIIVQAGTNTMFSNLQTWILGYFDVYGSLEVLGIDPVLNTIGAELYYLDNVSPNVESDNFDNIPYIEYCGGEPGNGDACSDEVPSNIQLIVDQNINEVYATWEGGNDCDEYYVTVYSSGVLTGEFSQTTSDNSASFSGLPPGEYLLGVYCTCNSTYESSDPVGFTIDFDEIITDYTTDDCNDVCNYSLTLTTSEMIAGGAIDWLSEGYYLELIVDGVSGVYWLTDQEFTHTWNITACTNATFQGVAHAESSGGFITSSGAHISLVTSSSATVFDVDMDSYLDLENIGVSEVEIFSGVVNCDLECNPPIITNSTVITDPPNVTIIDWDDDAGCSSYTIRWKTDTGFDIWTESTVTESQFQIPFLFTFTGSEDIEYQIRCNCAGGGVGAFSSSESFTYTPYTCDPMTPIDIEMSNIGSTVSNISWGSVNDILCSTYKVRIRIVGGGDDDWLNLISTTPSYEFTNLQANTEYEVQVACSCGLSESPYASSIFFTTLEVQDCSIVEIQNIQSVNPTLTTIDLTWDEDNACDTYTIRYIEDGASLWTIINSTTESITLTDLSPNTQYSVQVRCNCSEAIGEYADVNEFVTVVGIESIDLTIWSIYPNPTDNFLFIERKDNEPYTYSIELTDMVGRTVLIQQMNEVVSSVDLSRLSPGSYILNLITEDSESQKARIIIE